MNLSIYKISNSNAEEKELFLGPIKNGQSFTYGGIHFIVHEIREKEVQILYEKEKTLNISIGKTEIFFLNPDERLEFSIS